MNIICIKDKLKEGVDLVGRIAGTHPTLSIIKNILIEATKDKIRLTTTDLELAVQHTVPGKIVEAGQITVPANLLNQLLGALTEDRINLYAKGSVLEVVTDSYNAKIQGSPADEFPLIPKIEKNTGHIEIDSKTLKDALDKVLAATQFSELRPELNSVLMNFNTDRLVFAATDSFRLAEKTLNESEFSATFEDEFKILIPLKTVMEVARALKKDGKTKISRDQNQVLFVIDGTEIISRLLEGTFPDYHAIIPKEYRTELIIPSADLATALKLASVFSGAAPEVSLCASQNTKAVEIRSRDEKLGENKALIPAKVSGEFKEINFNWKYLLDGIRSLDAKEIVFNLSEENRPALLRARDDSSYFYIVMPILKG